MSSSEYETDECEPEFEQPPPFKSSGVEKKTKMASAKKLEQLKKARLAKQKKREERL